MYAIINISGKQYKATKGSRVRVPKQNGDSGKTLTFNNVFLIHNGKTAQVGTPTVKGASVTATIIDHGRDKKILVYKKKRRKGYQRKNGHRQWYTELEFQSINTSTEKESKTTSKKQSLPVLDKVQEEE